MLFIPQTYAKYITSKKINKTLDVAKPVFVVEGEETTKISKINNIGYYEFSIKNFNETNISEVGFIYTIEIISDKHESIQFELYKEEDIIKLDNLKTEPISIGGKEKIEQKYKLKVVYDSSKSKEGNDILEEVQIKVHSEQEKI